MNHDEEIADHLRAKIDLCEKLIASEARIAQLEALLRELIDIEGPQPGHVMWAQKVAAALGTTLETEGLRTFSVMGEHQQAPCPCEGHPYNCFHHPVDCGCTQKSLGEPK